MIISRMTVLEKIRDKESGVYAITTTIIIIIMMMTMMRIEERI